MTDPMYPNMLMPIRAVNQKKKRKGITKREGIKRKKLKNTKNLLRIKCPVCFERLGIDAASATICGHVFCSSCLEKALRLKSRCPICRRILKGAKASCHLYLDVNVLD